MFFSSKKVAFILGNFADPDDTPRVVEFYLGVSLLLARVLA